MVEVFFVFLRLGCTSFGGPVAHLGFFRNEFVLRRKWLAEHAYADLVALCQFLPGPTSSQVGMALGLGRAGLAGMLAAWVGFTLPSALCLVAFGMGMRHLGLDSGGAWLHGLKIAAVAVVAQAIWGMGRVLTPDLLRILWALAAAGLALALPGTLGQVGIILVSGACGSLLLKSGEVPPALAPGLGAGRGRAIVALALFFSLLLALPFATALGSMRGLALFNAFYRAGSLVFGGGHVVLPLLRSQLVPIWMGDQAFLAGYGAAQAMPGPLFSVAAYLGCVTTGDPSGWLGALVALTAIFLPSFLLVLGVLPFWEILRELGWMRRALLGVNAAVLGLLLAAFINPVWATTVHTAIDLGILTACLVMLLLLKLPNVVVVACAGLAGALLGS
jgi:chromate transporter